MVKLENIQLQEKLSFLWINFWYGYYCFFSWIIPLFILQMTFLQRLKLKISRHLLTQESFFHLFPSPWAYHQPSHYYSRAKISWNIWYQVRYYPIVKHAIILIVSVHRKWYDRILIRHQNTTMMRWKQCFLFTYNFIFQNNAVFDWNLVNYSSCNT